MKTDEQRAIEFAEYLAQSAEAFMRAVDRFQIALDEEAEDIADAEASLSEYWSGLESSIYEFRKRAARVED
jgi:hypothetical protein